MPTHHCLLVIVEETACCTLAMASPLVVCMKSLDSTGERLRRRME